MAFDYRYFADALQRAAQQFGSRYEQEYQRQQEEQYAIRDLKRRALVEQSAWNTRRNLEMEDYKIKDAMQRKNEEELQHHQNELLISRQEELDRHTTELKAFAGSEDFRNRFKGAMESVNLPDKMLALKQFSAINKLSEGGELDKSEEFAVQHLDPVSLATISDLRRKNADRMREISRDLAYTNYMQANTKLLRERETPGALNDNDYRSAITNLSNSEREISLFMQRPEFERLVIADL